MVAKKGLNSKNSSLPPSQDPNREKKSRAKGERKVGGQKGHYQAFCMNLGISAGTIYNFNVEAYEKLAVFEAWKPPTTNIKR